MLAPFKDDYFRLFIQATQSGRGTGPSSHSPDA
jgi:hypothetical protein